jgi:hypothetical protein
MQEPVTRIGNRNRSPGTRTVHSILFYSILVQSSGLLVFWSSGLLVFWSAAGLQNRSIRMNASEPHLLRNTSTTSSVSSSTTTGREMS